MTVLATVCYRDRISSIKDGIDCQRRNLSHIDSHHTTYVGAVTALAVSLHELFLHNGDVSVLDEAVTLSESLLTISCQPIEKAAAQDALGSSLHSRHLQTSKLTDLRDAVLMQRAALEIRSYSGEDVRSSLRDLGTSLTTLSRYHPFDNRSLEEAIDTFRRCLALYAYSDVHAVSALSGLSEALMLCYWATGQNEALEEAIKLSRSATILTLPEPQTLGYIASRVSLGRALKSRFVRGGNPSDSSEAVQVLEAAIEGLPSHAFPSQWAPFCALADVLLFRGHRSQSVEDLTRAKYLACRAVDLCHHGHFYRARALQVLASASHWLYAAAGSEELLHEAVALNRECITSSPSPDSQECLTATANLGAALYTRYRIQGGMEDIEEAISLLTLRIQALPRSHIDYHHFLQNLANLHGRRFKVLGELADQETTLHLRREVVALCPPNEVRRPIYLANLALSLASAAQARGTSDYLAEAASVAKEALSSFPEKSRHTLAGLGVVLRKAWEHGMDPDGLEASIQLKHSILSVMVTGHPDRADHLSELAKNLFLRFRATSNQSDLAESMAAYREAILDEDSTIHNRFEAALAWISCAEEIKDIDIISEAYRRAVSLFPRVAYLALNPKQRLASLRHIQEIPKLVQKGVVHFSTLGHREASIELLEEGRYMLVLHISLRAD
jgi:tetratricopeptide (TPR) repeat protein